jgi:hypothetical protein
MFLTPNLVLFLIDFEPRFWWPKSLSQAYIRGHFWLGFGYVCTPKHRSSPLFDIIFWWYQYKWSRFDMSFNDSFLIILDCFLLQTVVVHVGQHATLQMPYFSTVYDHFAVQTDTDMTSFCVVFDVFWHILMHFYSVLTCWDYWLHCFCVASFDAFLVIFRSVLCHCLYIVLDTLSLYIRAVTQCDMLVYTQDVSFWTIFVSFLMFLTHFDIR